MPFTIPNESDAAFADQARVDSVDLLILAGGMNGNGVVSGCAVTTTGTTNGSVAVATGEIRINDLMMTVSASAALAIGANATGNPRYDLVTVATGASPRTAVVTAGTAAASPKFPAIPANSVVLAAVRVPNGHTTGTNIPANTIIDKRVMVLDTGTQVPNNYLVADTKGVEWLFRQKDTESTAVKIISKQHTGAPGDYANTLLEVTDYLGAPIAWVAGVGGIGVNDDLYTAYSVLGDYPFRADIYGYQWRKSQCTYAFPGPPGNMLDFPTACHEIYQATRLPSLGMWASVAACTIATHELGAPPPTDSPTGYRRALRITNTTGGSAWIATWGGALAQPGVVAGNTYSFVFSCRSATAAASRNANLRVAWFTSGGTQVGGDVVGSTVAIPNTGVWTLVSMPALVAPATAARVQMQFVIASANGELHDVCGAGIMPGIEAKFGPPFVAQRPPTDPPIADGSIAGDRWVRTDTPNRPGQREYVQLNNTISNPAQPHEQSWRPMESADIIRLLADVTNSTTTPANLTPFAYAVDANTEYVFEWTVGVTSAALSTGWLFGITGPGSPTSVHATHEYQSSATAWTTATISSFTDFTLVANAYVATPTIIQNRIRLMLVTGATAGTVNLRFRSEVAASAIVVKRGAVMNVY